MNKILLLPGDGIGYEISQEAKKIFSWFNDNTSIKFEVEEELIGGASIDSNNTPLSDDVLDKALKSDAILLGAVGGPKWEKLDFQQRPERGLLKIRKELDLFANLRPALVFESLKDASSLKEHVISGLDIMIIRELTSGIYFGEPRGIIELSDKVKKGFNTLVYTSDEIERIARVAFEISMQRSKKLCSVDKANVLESTELWREVIKEVSKDFPQVELSHMYVDNASMQLVKNPKQFDVIVTTNMFGDILSDCASMLTGSLGMLPSASLGKIDQLSNKRMAMYEPVHGSAPDIAGKNIANPLAMIQSIVMMLKYSFSSLRYSNMLQLAVEKTLAKGFRTQDLVSSNEQNISTSIMGDKIIDELNLMKR
tara:strand:- start:1029 stop:2132 length:1104 start_codon:yes stop_codon:yes gene_type:complete